MNRLNSPLLLPILGGMDRVLMQYLSTERVVAHYFRV